MSPRENDNLRELFGDRRKALAKSVEWLMAFHFEPEPFTQQERAAFEKMRKGVAFILEGRRALGDSTWEDLPFGAHLASWRQVRRQARQRPDPAAPWIGALSKPLLETAAAWLDSQLGPRRARHRPASQARVVLGVGLAALFREHGERVTFGRDGLFARALTIVLDGLGYPAPVDPLRLLRAIRTRARVRP